MYVTYYSETNFYELISNSYNKMNPIKKISSGFDGVAFKYMPHPTCTCAHLQRSGMYAVPKTRRGGEGCTPPSRAIRLVCKPLGKPHARTWYFEKAP